MSRYFFHTYDATDVLDHIGTEYDTWSNARADALGLAGQILKDRRTDPALGADWSMEVTDHRGAVLFCLDVQMTDARGASGPCRPIPPQV